MWCGVGFIRKCTQFKYLEKALWMFFPLCEMQVYRHHQGFLVITSNFGICEIFHGSYISMGDMYDSHLLSSTCFFSQQYLSNKIIVGDQWVNCWNSIHLVWGFLFRSLHLFINRTFPLNCYEFSLALLILTASCPLETTTFFTTIFFFKHTFYAISHSLLCRNHSLIYMCVCFLNPWLPSLHYCTSYFMRSHISH